MGNKLFRQIPGDEDGPLWGPTNVLRYSPENSLETDKWINLDGRYARLGDEFTGTPGSIIFVGEDTYLDEDNPFFFYDKTNNRVGLGLNTGLTARLNFVTGTTAAAGIAFGSDITLYRSAADNLKTDDTFEVGANFKFPNTTALGANGVFYKAGTRFLHAYGNNNIFLGQGAGNFTTSAGLFNGSNIGIGTSALALVSTGYFNTAVGSNAGVALTTASSVTYIGFQAGKNQTGSSNTSLGDGALFGVAGFSTGTNNTALGRNAAGGVTTGSNNVVVGMGAAGDMTTGSNNIIIGYTTGTVLSTGSNNILIGYAIVPPSSGSANYLSIADTIYGDTSTKQITVNASTIEVSAQLQVDSTTRGFLPPRMTTGQRDLISSPVKGLMIYNTTTDKFQGYNGAWVDLN